MIRIGIAKAAWPGFIGFVGGMLFAIFAILLGQESLATTAFGFAIFSAGYALGSS